MTATGQRDVFRFNRGKPPRWSGWHGGSAGARLLPGGCRASRGEAARL